MIQGVYKIFTVADYQQEYFHKTQHECNIVLEMVCRDCHILIVLTEGGMGKVEVVYMNFGEAIEKCKM